MLAELLFAELSGAAAYVTTLHPLSLRVLDPPQPLDCPTPSFANQQLTYCLRRVRVQATAFLLSLRTRTARYCRTKLSIAVLACRLQLLRIGHPDDVGVIGGIVRYYGQSCFRQRLLLHLTFDGGGKNPAFPPPDPGCTPLWAGPLKEDWPA